MEIALVARADTRTFLNQFIGEMRTHFSSHHGQPATKKSAASKLLPLQLPEAVRKDISKSKVSFEDVVILRKKISLALAKKLIFEFLDAVERDRVVLDGTLRIAFDFYGSGLLVWVHTPSTDLSHKARFDAIRDQLNSSYSAAGLSVSLAYFTEEDEMPFPPQYVPEAEVLFLELHTNKRTRRVG